MIRIKKTTMASESLWNALYLSKMLDFTGDANSMIAPIAGGVTFFFAPDYPMLAPAGGAAVGVFAAMGRMHDSEKQLGDYVMCGISSACAAVAAEFLAARLVGGLLDGGILGRALVAAAAGFGAYEGFMQPMNRFMGGNPPTSPVDYLTSAVWLTTVGLSLVVIYGIA